MPLRPLLVSWGALSPSRVWVGCLGWVALGLPWVLGPVWSPLGFKFLLEVSFGGAQYSTLPSIFVFTSRFVFLVSR